MYFERQLELRNVAVKLAAFNYTRFTFVRSYLIESIDIDLRVFGLFIRTVINHALIAQTIRVKEKSCWERLMVHHSLLWDHDEKKLISSQ